MIFNASLRRLSIALLTVAGVAALSVGNLAHAQTAYSISGSGTSLIRFDLATPGTVTTVGAFSGGALDSLDFRPSDGLLYGYSQVRNQVVTIDLTTAETTFVSTLSTGSTTTSLGLDFNPVADRLRLVNQNDQNLRINVATGATTDDGATNGLLRYAPGDANFGIDPNVVEVAYENNFAGTGSTTIYYIDSRTDSLVKAGGVPTTDPNSGLLNTVRRLTLNGTNLNVDNQTGFDIFTTSSGVNQAYAKFRISGVNGLYSVDLESGATRLIGNLANPAGGQVFGLAIQPTAIAAPEPGSMALAGTGLLGAMGMVVRRRRAA